MTLIAPDLTPLDDDEMTEALLALVPSGEDPAEGLCRLLRGALDGSLLDEGAALEMWTIVLRNWAYNDREALAAALRDTVSEAAAERDMTSGELLEAMRRGDSLAMN